MTKTIPDVIRGMFRLSNDCTVFGVRPITFKMTTEHLHKIDARLEHFPQNASDASQRRPEFRVYFISETELWCVNMQTRLWWCQECVRNALHL